jgi:hypothetical protein
MWHQSTPLTESISRVSSQHSDALQQQERTIQD